NLAYLLSIGDNPTDFRIYKTEDGGATWVVQFVNHIATAFYDAFAFWTETRGIVHSDSVNGTFPDRRTLDGMTWQSIRSNMPPALLSPETTVKRGRSPTARLSPARFLA